MIRRLLVAGAALAAAGVALAQLPSPSRTLPGTTRSLPGGVQILPSSSRPLPRPEAVAETRLLMDALAQPNYQGLERLLAQKPADAEAWSFARGQALLLAETANLLMLRPPRTEGREVWTERAADLRAVAIKLARAAGTRDYEQARAQLPSVAMMCNRCHRTFRVSAEVGATPKAPAEGSDRPPAP